jgi:hypothetical protein
MRTVEMDLRPSELSGAMAEMRIWLDERRFEPSIFCCRRDGAGFLVRVDFKVAGEAEAFAARFSGRIDAALAGRGGEGRTSDVSSALSPGGGVV